jgi:hypothetical protein
MADMTLIEAVTWQRFEDDAPELAAFGRKRLQAGASYLATTRADGSPRVHPINPKVRGGHLSVYMFPTSPKAADLRRDRRFALHASVEDVHGGGGEFSVRGIASFTSDRDPLCDELAVAGLPARDGYLRFDLLLLAVLAGTYVPGSNVPRLRRWQAV